MSKSIKKVKSFYDDVQDDILDRQSSNAKQNKKQLRKKAKEQEDFINKCGKYADKEQD